MHLKSKVSVINLCKWQSVGALALIVCGSLGGGATGLAQQSFPPPLAARPAVQFTGLNPGPLGGDPVPPPDSPNPFGAVSASWEGISSDIQWEPPDPHGAAGPNGIVQTVNLRIKYWNKSGAGIWGPIDLSTFWSSVGIKAANILSDPRVMFDHVSGHFYVALLEADDSASKSYLNLAVSKTANPATSGPADWYFYRIEDTETIGSTKYWTDYPGMGVDGQAVYVTYNMYSFPVSTASFKNAIIISLNKAAINSGTTNYTLVFTPAASSGFTLQPCSVLGGSSPSNVAYFAETPIMGNFATSVRIWALKDPLGAKTLTSTSVTVPNNGGYPPYSGAPQPGTSFTIDTLDGRTQGNAFWDNGAVWFCTTAGGSSGKSVVYYYKINLNNYPSGTPTLGEAGFIDGGSGEWTYQPSIGANSRGDVGIVYCQSSTARYPTIFAATRSSVATAFGTPVLIKASPSYYYGGRWGDYASVTADPVDDSFWVTHEWAKSSSVIAWSTWWAQLAAPSGKADGILEATFTPPNGTTLVAGKTQSVFVQVADGLSVTNATVIATVDGGTNLTFLNNGVAPDVAANDGTYSANLAVPVSTNDITLGFRITAPGKTNSTNIVIYSVVPLPANDYFTNATKVPTGGAVYLSNNRFATKETGEQAHAGVASAGASLWWSWSPASNSSVLIDTTASTMDTVVAVYTGLTVSNLTVVAATNDVATKMQAYLHFDAIAGTAYRIAVASANSNSVGSLRVVIAPGGQLDTNPPTVSVTSPLSGLWVSNFLVTVSGIANDPQPNFSGLTRVLVSVNGQLPITATGTANWSSTFGLIPGVNTINVTAVDLAGNVSQPVVLQVTYVIVNPVNDLLANALSLTAVPDVASATTTNATKEFSEPVHAGNNGGKSVWWRYQPPADGALTLSTTNSTFDTLLGIYSGPRVSELTTVASNDDAYPGSLRGFSALTQAVRSNQTYYVAVDGFDGASGMVSLGYNFTPSDLFTLTLSNAGGGLVAEPSGNLANHSTVVLDVISNSTVVLTGVPDPYFEFGSWTGDLTATANPLSLVVSSNISLTGHFRPISFTDDFETGNLMKLGWSSSGDHPWTVQTNNVLTGSFSAQSGDIGDSQTSSLSFTTNFGGGVASFYFKVSSETGWDFLNFVVDGVLQQQWSGEIDWTSYSFPLSFGSHTLEWRYTKDSTISKGLDAAFLDNVRLPISLPIDASTPAYLQLLMQTNDSVLILGQGQTNREYVIQRATNLAFPIGWQNISTNLATFGSFQYVDPGTGTNPIRYYRAVTW